MNKFEFLNPPFAKYNSNELDEIKVLRKIVFHLIREIHVLRETNIQNAIDNQILPKDSTYGKLYKEICIYSHNSSGPCSGEAKILTEWFDPNSEKPDELLMLQKLKYTQEEISVYLKDVDDVSEYT